MYAFDSTCACSVALKFPGYAIRLGGVRFRLLSGRIVIGATTSAAGKVVSTYGIRTSLHDGPLAAAGGRVPAVFSNFGNFATRLEGFADCPACIGGPCLLGPLSSRRN